jgi:hypothetical protein
LFHLLEQAGDGNYNPAPDMSQSFSIAKATLTVTAENKNREYGDPNPVLTASYSGFKNGETLTTSGISGSPDLTTTVTATSPVPGPYTITAELGTLTAGNYQFSFVNGQLTITKAMLIVKADDKSRVYGAPNPSFTASYSGFKNGETLATSGVSGSSSLTTTAIATNPPGAYTITAAMGTLTATNYGFGFTSGTLTVTPYSWTGFFRPIDNLPTSNIAKAGSAIPVKFNLDGNQGLNIFEANYPKTVGISCDTNAPTDNIDETVNAGGSSLSYDDVAKQYVYVWKTDKNWGNSCRQLQVIMVTVLPETVHCPDAAKFTGNPDEAVALTPKAASP